MIRHLRIVLDLDHTARFQAAFLHVGADVIGELVAKSDPLILFIPTSMSTLQVPRWLSRTQPAVKSETRRSFWGLSPSINCTASLRSLRPGTSSGERVRVVVGAVRVVIVLIYLKRWLGKGRVRWE